jgi:pyruvate kinase
VPFERVPRVQKDILRSQRRGVPRRRTQVLESMRENAADARR